MNCWSPDTMSAQMTFVLKTRSCIIDGYTMVSGTMSSPRVYQAEAEAALSFECLPIAALAWTLPKHRLQICLALERSSLFKTQELLSPSETHAILSCDKPWSMRIRWEPPILRERLLKIAHNRKDQCRARCAPGNRDTAPTIEPFHPMSTPQLSTCSQKRESSIRMRKFAGLHLRLDGVGRVE